MTMNKKAIRFLYLMGHPYHVLTLQLIVWVYLSYTIDTLHPYRLIPLALLLGLLVARIAYVKITGRTSSDEHKR